MQHRQLQTWLTEDEFAQIEAEWLEQKELREELKDKPSELKRYEENLMKRRSTTIVQKAIAVKANTPLQRSSTASVQAFAIPH